jgi:hypothetical protein
MLNYLNHPMQIEIVERFSKEMAVKENDLVATGILPVISNRQAGSLSHQSISGAETHCV